MPAAQGLVQTFHNQAMQVPPDGIAPLAHLGIIRAQGADAVQFIHSQLSSDFVRLGPDEARLATFCSAKGRMLASFIGLKYEGGILLLCHRSLLEATLKRLRMFVLRAKCVLDDATAEFALWGLLGGPARHPMQAGDESPAPWRRRNLDADDGGATVLQLYPAWGQPRALWLGRAGSAPPHGAPLPADAWPRSEVASGIATISAPVVDAFVPQMLNYESVGGVDFKKGCWPGQEVVARSQFRGKLKRRAFIAHALQGSLHAGMDVFAEDDWQQSAGTVVQAAADAHGACNAIISLQTAAAAKPLFAHAPLAAGAQAQPQHAVALQLQPLPYPLLEDI